MSMEIGPIYHPDTLVRYCLLAMIVFPFASIPLLKWKPRMHLGYFFLPLILGAILLFHGIYSASVALAINGQRSWLVMAAAIAEAILSLFFGAGSAFATALLQIRSRRRGLSIVLAVSAAIMLACWAAGNHYLRIARTGQCGYGAASSMVTAAITSAPARTP
jgi:MFS family permease